MGEMGGCSPTGWLEADALESEARAHRWWRYRWDLGEE